MTLHSLRSGFPFLAFVVDPINATSQDCAPPLKGASFRSNIKKNKRYKNVDPNAGVGPYDGLLLHLALSGRGQPASCHNF